MRIVAVLFAVVPVLVSLLLVFVSGFAVAFCDENCDPTAGPSSAAITLIVASAGSAMVAALAFLIFVAANEAMWANVTFAVFTLFVVGLLAFWLTVSAHSDDRLFGVAGFVELFAVFALLVCRQESRQREEQSRR